MLRQIDFNKYLIDNHFICTEPLEDHELVSMVSFLNNHPEIQTANLAKAFKNDSNYAVLKDVKHITNLVLNSNCIGKMELAAIAKLPLQDLTLDNMINETNVDGLTAFQYHPTLKKLKLTKCSHLEKAATALASIKQLTSLDVSGSKIEDGNGFILAFKDHATLTELDISLTHIADQDLEVIGTFKSLTKLNLSNTTIRSLKGLSSLANTLTELSLEYLSDLPFNQNDINIICSLTNLKTLSLFWNHKITDEAISLLAKSLTQLNFLDLSGTSMTEKSLKDLSTLSCLTHLHLNETKITGEAFEFFLSPIEELYLDNTDIKDDYLPFLSKFPLKSLDLSNTQITNHSCTEIIKLNNLNNLILDRTKINAAGLKIIRNSPIKNALIQVFTDDTEEDIEEEDAEESMEEVEEALKTSVNEKQFNKTQKALEQEHLSLALNFFSQQAIRRTNEQYDPNFLIEIGKIICTRAWHLMNNDLFKIPVSPVFSRYVCESVGRFYFDSILYGTSILALTVPYQVAQSIYLAALQNLPQRLYFNLSSITNLKEEQNIFKSYQDAITYDLLIRYFTPQYQLIDPAFQVLKNQAYVDCLNTLVIAFNNFKIEAAISYDPNISHHDNEKIIFAHLANHCKVQPNQPVLTSTPSTQNLASSAVEDEEDLNDTYISEIVDLTAPDKAFNRDKRFWNVMGNCTLNELNLEGLQKIKDAAHRLHSDTFKNNRQDEFFSLIDSLIAEKTTGVHHEDKSKKRKRQ